jgi:hypothetical protein
MRELLVKVSEKLGIYQMMMNLDTKIQMHKQNKAFMQYGLDALREAEAAADEAGCRLFLAFGSLLGAYREKGFIPFDCDLDTGMLAGERSKEFVDAMKRHGLTLLRQYYVKTTGRVCEDKFDFNGVHLDVHYFYPDPDETIHCELCLPHENKPWREANASDGFPAIVRTLPASGFAKGDFLGLQVYLPTKTEEWLKTLYGEHFMTPDPNWGMGDHKKRAVMSPDRLYRR